MVGVAGFEPTTPCPPDKCANRAALHSDVTAYREAGTCAQPHGSKKAAFSPTISGPRHMQDARTFVDLGQRSLQRAKIGR